MWGMQTTLYYGGFTILNNGIAEEKQPDGLWVCHPCLKNYETGDYLHIRKIETNYVKCKSCEKNLAVWQFLTRRIDEPNLTYHSKCLGGKK